MKLQRDGHVGENHFMSSQFPRSRLHLTNLDDPEDFRPPTALLPAPQPPFGPHWRLQWRFDASNCVQVLEEEKVF